jgi:signal transduction histidine kinase
LLSGDVKIKFPAHNYISNKIFNDFFGEKELCDKTRRNSSAVANSKCLLYTIEQKVFEMLLTKSQTIEKNIKSLGEVELPEMESVSSSINLGNSDKPISFKATIPDGEETLENNIAGPEDIDESISETISKIIEEEKFGSNTNLEIGQKDKPERDKKSNLNIELDNSSETDVVQESEKEIETLGTDLLADQINIRSIFEVLNSIHGHLAIFDTIQSIINSLKQLTSSEAGEVYIIDEDAGEMEKYVDEDGAVRIVRNKISDGLTGTCVLQKRILNFDQPTADSRFIEHIDQPGNTAHKFIIYVPLITGNEEFVAVLQLARNYKSFTKDEKKQLELISNQAALSIERSKKHEQLIEEEKKKANNNVSMFLSDNILIPVDIMNRYTSLLNNEEFSQKVKEVISMLQKQANLFWDIIQSTFDYNKMEFELNLEKTSLNSYLDSISELLSEYCDSRNVNLFKRTGEDCLVKIDPGKLFMALYQVIKNACDALDTDGNLYISSEKNADNVKINITDEGSGIEEEQKEKIFKSVFDKEKGRNKLGLTITKKIIDLHAGEITFSSIIYEGTTFSISIPIYIDDHSISYDDHFEPAIHQKDPDSRSNELNIDENFDSETKSE